MACNVVFGAGGGTGADCVKRLLQVSSLPVRAVVRDPEKYKGVWGDAPKLEVFRGDVTDEASLRAVMHGAQGVIFAASGKGYWSPAQVDFQGVQNVAAAAKAVGAKRVVLVSSMLVTRKNWWHPMRLLLNNIRYAMMDNKLKGEDALRASGVPFTVVRPGGLTKDPAGQKAIKAVQGDKPELGQISRADVAAICVEALTNPGAANVTVEVVSKGPLSGTFDAELKNMWQGLTHG